MAQPYVGEIRMFAGNFAPAGWMFCEGQLLPISENETLFQLIGTTYGGDGESDVRAARSARPPSDPSGQRLHPGRDRGRGGDHADGAADSGAQSPAAGVDRRGGNVNTPTGNVTAESAAVNDLSRGTPRRGNMRRQCDRTGRRQPAAHQLPALSVRQLHHLAVRDLPVPNLREDRRKSTSPGNHTLGENDGRSICC